MGQAPGDAGGKYNVMLACDPSCKSCVNSKPTGCTSCMAATPHHTVVDPLKMAGTCTKEFCPQCKAKQCCPRNHKHFVIETQRMEGVCVKHTDNCQPLCLPKASSTDEVPLDRVCSKGCNQLALANSQEFVVCQAQKQVKCTAKDGMQECKVEKEIQPEVICPYKPELWSAGATCILAAATGSTFKNTSDGTTCQGVESDL